MPRYRQPNHRRLLPGVRVVSRKLNRDGTRSHGVIIERDGHHPKVRWDDGTETLVHPGNIAADKEAKEPA
jgi:hypothetical protein